MKIALTPPQKPNSRNLRAGLMRFNERFMTVCVQSIFFVCCPSQPMLGVERETVMKQFELVVNLPPDDVMRRLKASIDQPNVSLMNPFAGKDFYGQLSGYQFWLRNRRRWSRNSLAPVCKGNVLPNGSGSTIDFSIGAKFTFLWILGGIFLLLSLCFAIFFGMIGFVMTSGDSRSAIPSLLLAIIMPLFVIVFFGGFFFIGKQMGKSDERSLGYFLQNLFRDVIVQPVQFAQPMPTTR
jgi:hypothetical protein